MAGILLIITAYLNLLKLGTNPRVVHITVGMQLRQSPKTQIGLAVVDEPAIGTVSLRPCARI
jgi:hypothetical protein